MIAAHLRPAPFPFTAIFQNGPRRQGFASPRNNGAPWTAPLPSEHVPTRGKGEVRKSWPVVHFYLAGIGHFYLAVTCGRFLLTMSERTDSISCTPLLQC